MMHEDMVSDRGSCGVGQWSVTCQLYFEQMLIGQQPGGKYRRDNQAGSRGREMRPEEFWEEECSLGSPDPATEEARCDCLTKKGTEPHG